VYVFGFKYQLASSLAEIKLHCVGAVRLLSDVLLHLLFLIYYDSLEVRRDDVSSVPQQELSDSVMWILSFRVMPD
jgi:hypothetical protein